MIVWWERDFDEIEPTTYNVLKLFDCYRLDKSVFLNQQHIMY